MPAQRRRETAQQGQEKTTTSPPSQQQRRQQSTGRGHRDTKTHIFFWGGILSNWDQGRTFLGSRCFELLLPELDKLAAETEDNNNNNNNSVAVHYPSRDAFITRLLSDHAFNCGEQWMMAIKAWLFETPSLPALARTSSLLSEDNEYARLKAGMYAADAPPDWTPDERAVWASTAPAVLRAQKPGVQKALGRRAAGFDQRVWDVVGQACVVAACVARAEQTPALRELYVRSKGKQFVEGSPTDAIWGVGLHWQSSEIEDPANWKGENRLGRCHDLAAERVRQGTN